MSHQTVEPPSKLEQFNSSAAMKAVIKPLSTVTDRRLLTAELLSSKLSPVKCLMLLLNDSLSGDGMLGTQSD